MRDGLQNVAAGVEHFRPRDFTTGGFVGVQNDLGVDKYTGGDPLIQSLAKSGGSCHVRVCSRSRAESRVGDDERYLYGARPFRSQGCWDNKISMKSFP